MGRALAAACGPRRGRAACARAQPRRPLDDDDWKALVVAFDDPGGHNIDVALGLLTVVVTAPTPIPPSMWLPLVLGDRELEGPNDSTLGLILPMYNTISAPMADGEVMCPAADDVENIEHFCSGYMIGVEMDEAWSQTFEAMEPVFPIADPELNRTGFHGDRFT